MKITQLLDFNTGIIISPPPGFDTHHLIQQHRPWKYVAPYKVMKIENAGEKHRF